MRRLQINDKDTTHNTSLIEISTMRVGSNLGNYDNAQHSRQNKIFKVEIREKYVTENFIFSHASMVPLNFNLVKKNLNNIQKNLLKKGFI